jgi:multimeric flavodoxin WrbA
MDGNSFSLVQSVLQSARVNYEIVQLSDKNIEYCDLCGQCLKGDCILDDDLNGILRKMEKADGIVIAFPKYLLAPSKFLAFLERLNTIVHMRRHRAYEYAEKQVDYRLFTDKKLFCILALSGTGNFEQETLKLVADYIESLGLKPIANDKSSFPGVVVRTGDRKGEVLKNTQGTEQCTRLVKQLVQSLK